MVILWSIIKDCIYGSGMELVSLKSKFLFVCMKSIIAVSVCVYMHAHTHAHIHTHTCTRTHAHAHTHTHTHTHTDGDGWMLNQWFETTILCYCVHHAYLIVKIFVCFIVIISGKLSVGHSWKHFYRTVTVSSLCSVNLGVIARGSWKWPHEMCMWLQTVSENSLARVS